MPIKTDTQIQQLLDNNSELTNSETLELYRQTRDQILARLFSDEYPLSITIRGRTVELRDPDRLLNFIERMIRYYESRADTETAGIARNYARLKR